MPPAFAHEAQSNFSSWQNSIASIGSNNSLSQHTEYALRRISYQECANLATDTLINKAITTIVNEMFKESGEFTAENAEDENFIKDFDEEVKKFNLEKTVRLACRKALEYGGSFIYIDTTDEDVSQPLYMTKYTTSNTRLQGFRVLEPWQVAPIEVNSFNPLKTDYMRPVRWYVMGAEMNVHYTRLIPVSFFAVPELLKPIFNYFGLPLSFFMKSFVSSAETSRQCIAELLLRFRTDYIKTTAQRIENPEYRARVKFMNATKNNFGTALLSSEEDIIQINTPISGLDNILSQMYELVTMTTGMPVTKFLGLSPRGFNATGEHDQNNYYDLIAGYQTNIALPAINALARAVAVLRLNADIAPEFTFNPLNRMSKTEQASLNNLKADFIKKLEEAGIISPDDGLKALQDDDFSFSWVKEVPEQQQGEDLGELGGFDDMLGGEDIKAMDEAGKDWDEEKVNRKNNGQFAPKGEAEAGNSTEEQKEENDNTEPTKEQQAEIESKIKQLDNIDFTKEATLPNLPSFVLKRYGLEDKPILLKDYIINKNLRSHKDITLEDTKIIFSHSLYKPEAILKANKDKPAYHNFISRVGEHKNTIVLLELSETKENFEIVNFHYLGERQKGQKSKGQ